MQILSTNMKYKLKLQIQSANKKCKSKMHKQSIKRALARPGVNCAKERLDQSFLFPGLEKVFYPWLWSLRCSQQPFPYVRGNFGMVTNEQTNDQSGELRASLPLISEKVVLRKILNKMPIQSANTNTMHIASFLNYL